MTSSKATPPKKVAHDQNWRTLTDFILSGELGSPQLVTELVVGTVQSLNWPEAHLEQLKLTLARAIQNALEQSSLNDSGVTLIIRVFIPEGDEAAQATVRPGNEPGQDQLSTGTVQPVARPLSRGWGFFLVQKQEGDPPVLINGSHHLIELFLYQESQRLSDR